MEHSQLEADVETARAALEEFEARRVQTAQELKAEAADVNARYQAAEQALLDAQRAENPPDPALAQTVGEPVEG